MTQSQMPAAARKRRSMSAPVTANRESDNDDIDELEGDVEDLGGGSRASTYGLWPSACQGGPRSRTRPECLGRRCDNTTILRETRYIQLLVISDSVKVFHVHV